MIELNSTIDPTSVNILIVDDIPLNILLIQKMLSRCKYNLLTANDGQQALDAIDANKVNLVLLDLMMPGIDGWEVIRRLRSNDDTKELPIVILSALNSNEDVTKGLKLGANDFITKPIIMETLLNCVAKTLNAQATA